MGHYNEHTLLGIQAIAHHRNGIAGAPFYVVLFTDPEEGSKPMVGIVFEPEYHVAVLELTQALAGNVAFAEGNSWRGDVYEPRLRQAIRHWEADRQRQQEEELARLQAAHATTAQASGPGLPCEQCGDPVYGYGLYCGRRCAWAAAEEQHGNDVAANYCPTCGGGIPENDSFCDAECASIFYGFNTSPDQRQAAMRIAAGRMGLPR